VGQESLVTAREIRGLAQVAGISPRDHARDICCGTGRRGLIMRIPSGAAFGALIVPAPRSGWRAVLPQRAASVGRRSRQVGSTLCDEIIAGHCQWVHWLSPARVSKLAVIVERTAG